MSFVDSDEDLMRNVVQLRDRLMQTENSIQKMNKLTEIIDAKPSISDSCMHGESDSTGQPAPLTLDDLGELTATHDETDYSPVDESVLRRWNMNNGTQAQNASASRSLSPENHLQVSQGYNGNSHSSHRSFKRNLKDDFAPRTLAGPSTSSPYMGRYGKPSSLAYSCDDLACETDIRAIYASDSYRMLKKPSSTSNFSASAPISPRRVRYREPSPSASDILPRKSGIFQPLQKLSSDSSLSALVNYTLISPRKSPRKDTSLDSDFSEPGKENVTPTRPVSARSNATSVTILGADAESDRLRGRLSMLREDNERLHSLVTSLRQQQKAEKSSKGPNDSKVVKQLKEEITALKEEVAANEKALRRAEETSERSEMVCQKKIESIVSLKDEISHLKSILTETELSKESATKNYKEAYQDAQHLARQLELVEANSASVEREGEKEKAQLQQEIRKLEKFKVEISEKAAELRRLNAQLQADLRNALGLKSNQVSERDAEKLHISRALQDLQARFGDVRADLKKKTEDLETAEKERASLRKKLESCAEQSHLEQDRLLSCQREIEEYRTKIDKMENELKKAKAKTQRNVGYAVGGPLDSGRGASVAFSGRVSPGLGNDDCRCESSSPRKQKAVIAELKMKLAAKEAQVQRLEARVNNFSMEAEKLEGIRGELINVVERSRMGDKRAHELEGIVHSLEDERSKVTRQLMEREDELSDKNAECESLETRLNERTKKLTQAQNELEDNRMHSSKLESEVKKYLLQVENLEKQIDSKTQECEARYSALQRAEEELAEKKRALDSAAEWTGKREAESKRETEKMKKIHKEQHQEMEAQIDRLQSDCDRYREQARELECAVCQLREENDAIVKRLRYAESELEDARSQDEAVRKGSQEALNILEKKAKESSEQVTCLQTALAQCKSEVRLHMEQLEEASSNFQHQMAVKNGQVAKMESDLKIAEESLKSESLHARALESNLAEKQKASDQASGKLAVLEDCRACLQSKVAKLKHQLGEANSAAVQEKEYWEGRLQAACRELEAKNKQFTQLNDALKEVDREFGSCRKDLATVEQQVEKLRADSNEKSKELDALRAEVGDMKAELAVKNEKVSNLEERLKQSESERQGLQEKCVTQENELVRAKAELQSMDQQSDQLQSALQTTDMDGKKKDTFIARLQNALREAKDSLAAKERSVEDLERALEDRQWELQQRAAQLGQLEVSVKEHKSISEKRQIELQAEARKAHIELKERNQQVATLDEELSNLRGEVSEQRHQVEEKDQELRRISRELEQREERIKSLEEALEESRSAYEERHRACLAVTQELRVAREQSQKAAQQWQDANRELSRLQHLQETLIGDLEAMGKTEKKKESHVSELAGKLAASEADRIDIEQRYVAELDRMRSDVFKIHHQHQEELAQTRKQHLRQLSQAKTTAGDRSEEIRNAMQLEQEAKADCETMRDIVTSLETELLARKQVIEAANDTIVVKEAEIARLEAKLAGIERGKRMQEFGSPEKIKKVVTDDEQPDFLPSFLCPDEKRSPNGLIKWSPSTKNARSPRQPHGSSTLFSGLDPDSGSLSPSFAHIAASTKRPNADDEALGRAALDRSTSADGSFFTRVFDRNESPDPILRQDARGSAGASLQDDPGLGFELRPEHCMADLRERLRASEQRRQEVTSKLRQLKSNGRS